MSKSLAASCALWLPANPLYPLVKNPTASLAIKSALNLSNLAASKYLSPATPRSGGNATTAAPFVDGCPIKLKSVRWTPSLT